MRVDHHFHLEEGPYSTGSVHFLDDIGTLLGEAEELLEQAGNKEIVYFQNRNRLFTPLQLGTGGVADGQI